MKRLSSKKLVLKRQTLRKLDETEMRHVAGGATKRCGGGTFVSACCPCTGTSNPPTSPALCPIE